MMQKLAHKLTQLDQNDPYRIKMTEQILEKAYDMGTELSLLSIWFHRSGLINTKSSLNQIVNMTASAFCRYEPYKYAIAIELNSSRRLSVVIVRNKYCETMKQACAFVEQGNISHCFSSLIIPFPCFVSYQGHIRVGPNVVTDPAFLVTRSMEDFITVCISSVAWYSFRYLFCRS